MAETPSIVGSIHAVVCVKCHLLQDYTDTQELGHCAAEKMSRGWSKCYSTEFYEIRRNTEKK